MPDVKLDPPNYYGKKCVDINKRNLFVEHQDFVRRKTVSVTWGSWDLMVGAVDPGLNGLGSSPVHSCFAVLLGKKRHFHRASFQSK